MKKNQNQKQSSINNIDPKDNNHNKNEDKNIETKDNKNNNTDKNKSNDHVQLLKQYISQINDTSFPKICKGKTTLHQVQKFSYKNEECYNYWKKHALTMENNHLYLKKLLWKCLIILQIIQKRTPISICLWVAMLH